MTPPSKLYHFGKSRYLREFLPKGIISFGLAQGFDRPSLTDGQRDDEMRRTSVPPPDKTTILVGTAGPDTAEPISDLISVNVTLGIRVPYFIKCFSLGYSVEMYEEVDGDVCIEISDVTELLRRFEDALNTQLPGWGAAHGMAKYWDFSKIPVGVTQLDLMFLKDSARYSCQQEYRVVLVPPAGVTVTDPLTRQELCLGPLNDICTERLKPLR